MCIHAGQAIQPIPIIPDGRRECQARRRTRTNYIADAGDRDATRVDDHDDHQIIDIRGAVHAVYRHSSTARISTLPIPRAFVSDSNWQRVIGPWRR
jgi:hypothetical protein